MYIRGNSVDFGKQVLALYLQAGAIGVTQLAQSRAVSNRVIPGPLDEITLDHPFESTSVIPCFTPSWNTSVFTTQISSTQFKVKFSVTAPDLSATLDYALRRGGSETVSANATSQTITHNLGNANAVILVSASWNTAIGRVSKAANSMVVDFSAQAPAAGGTLYWSQHSDESDITGEDEAVAADSPTHTITHNAGKAFLPAFFLPNWKTTLRWQSKGENQTTVWFATPPPSGGGLLDWRVKSVL